MCQTFHELVLIHKCVAQVRFFLNPTGSDDEPVHVAKAAPYVVGVAEDGSGAPKLWTFEAGDVEITAEIVPTDEDSEKQIVKECGVAIDEAAGQVRCLIMAIALERTMSS